MESTITLPDRPSSVAPGAQRLATETVEELLGAVESSVATLARCPAAGGGCEPQACPQRGACYQRLNEWVMRRGQYQRADVTVYDRIDIAGRFHNPEREWGEVNRLAGAYHLSRRSIYDIAGRVACLFEPRWPGPTPCLRQILPCGGRVSPPVEVGQTLSREAQERVRARMILTAVFPGGVTLRPLADLLDETPLVESRSAASLCGFVNQAGVRARQILSQVDSAGVKLPLILVQVDETFFDQRPVLFVVEPISWSIVGQYVPPDGDRSSETWGPLLLILKEDQHLDFFGGVGDAAKPYPGTFKLVLGREDSFQEDVFHPVRDMHTLAGKLESSAYRAFRAEYKADKVWKAEGTPEAQEKLSQAQSESVRQANLYDTYRQAMSWASDALEIVDLTSGEIRDRAINTWLLNEAVTTMSQLGHAEAVKMGERLVKHQPYLLRCLDWLETRLVPLRAELHTYLDDAELEKAVWHATARQWRLEHEVESMQHPRFRPAWERAEHDLALWIAGDDFLKGGCAQVHRLLEWVQRASSAVENINSIFKPLVEAKKHFSAADTYGNFVALFVLWHNLRVFKEGKREGTSPFEILGIDLGEKDWRTLLGYPPVQ